MSDISNLSGIFVFFHNSQFLLAMCFLCIKPATCGKYGFHVSSSTWYVILVFRARKIVLRTLAVSIYSEMHSFPLGDRLLLLHDTPPGGISRTEGPRDPHFLKH